jgi:uncharacterized protein
MSTFMDWVCLTTHGQGVTLHLRVTPNASRTVAGGLKQDRLSLRIKAPPVEGKANEAVRRWAAGTFGLRLSQVQLLRGARSRQKDLLLAGLSLEEAARTLDQLTASD